jgi:hypothetical protein
MRRLLALFVALAAMLALAVPAGAVTGNFTKDFEHPYVGLAVFYDADGNFSHRCSGTLLSPSIFLTAGHCTFGITDARVYFQQDAGVHYDPALGYDPVTGYPEFGGFTGTAYTYPLSDGNAYFPKHNNGDVGVIIFDQPIPTSVVSTYGSVAAPGSLDYLATARHGASPTVTISGYGISDVRPVTVSFRERLMATARIINVNSAGTNGFNLQITNNPGGGKGGDCFGDSGGPILWDSTDIVVAVVSFGINSNCAGVAYEYRVDQQAVLDWLHQFEVMTGETITVSNL